MVLPLDKEDYLRDFELPGSRAEFEKLLSRAQYVKQLSPRDSRSEAYAQVGRYVVDHCDVLIALWDGKPAGGPGGTAEIIHYAREKKCPLFWIHTDGTVPVMEEPGNGLSPQPFQGLDRYNSEPVDAGEIKRRVKEGLDFLLGQAESVRFPSNRLRAICEQLLPHHVRADLLALRYQHRYFKAGSLVYALAAAAVAVVAFQSLFVPHWPRIVLLEVVFMAAVLIIIWLGSDQRGDWHIK